MKQTVLGLSLVAGLLSQPMTALAQDSAQKPQDDPWWQSGKAALNERLAVRRNERWAKNVILFIGDGMGVSTLTAMRIFEGQSQGKPGEETVMPYERFPHSALIKTYNHNAQVPDSAGTASAMMTGVKTNMGVINMAADHPVSQCGNWRDGVRLSFAERAELAGKATGVVTTARLTHATPASVYAHSPSRGWEDDSSLPAVAADAGCKDIARQLIEFPYGNGLEVAMGGGRGSFMPSTLADPEYPDKKGRRKDGRNLIGEWTAKSNRHAYVRDLQELEGLDLAETDHLLGLFEPSHMQYEADRGDDPAGEPSLSAMTSAALDVLERDEDGFFLMVEGGRIDHAHHGGNAYRALSDGQAFAKAVQTALDRVDLNETLILVTADHSHVFTIAGYPARGNPILGLVRSPNEDGSPSDHPTLAQDEKPYTTLGYWNGPGAKTGERVHLSDGAASAHDHRQQAAIPLRSETHGGEDVALFAAGPWAHLAGGVLEQNVIYHIMEHATALGTQR